MGNGRFTYSISDEAEKVIQSRIHLHSNKNQCINWLVEKYPEMQTNLKTVQENFDWQKEENRKLKAENAVFSVLLEEEKKKRNIVLEFLGIHELVARTKTLDVRFDELFAIISDLIPKQKTKENQPG